MIAILVVSFLVFSASMSSDKWWVEFNSHLRTLHRYKKGCRFCKEGSCYTDFGNALAQAALIEWQKQWSTMPARVQDAHLLWMFHGERCPSNSASVVRSESSTALAPVVSSDPDTFAQERIPTSPLTSDTESERQPPRKVTRIEQTRIDTSPESASGSGQESPRKARKPQQRNDTSASRIDTSPESEWSSSLFSDSGEDAPTSKLQGPRAPYKGGKRRRAQYALSFLGVLVCLKAAMALMRVGQERLDRVRDGRPDGRRDRPQLPGKMTASVWHFLWRLYHSVGEGMPDKFDFAQQDAQTMVIVARGNRCKKPLHRSITAEDVDVEADMVPQGSVNTGEEEVRAIAAHAMHVECMRTPAEAVITGPGLFVGPRRYLPPGKRIHLYWEYTAWCTAWCKPVASFATFLRAFGKCDHVLRFRKVGQHAVCHTCTDYKQQLRKARLPQERQRLLEGYTTHILHQWLDRQVYGNAMTASLDCRRLLESGMLLIKLALSVSMICAIADGADQARFKVPRVIQQTKEIEKLYRPALHVQGVWAHGFGYHLAVMDADMKHDTNNNIEVISRLLQQIYETHGALPRGLHLQQDNTSRECKNSMILRWAIKLVALAVFEWVSLNYLITGHTHENLDATFGQLAVKLSAHKFDDDKELVELLLKLTGDIGVDTHSKRGSLAYKLDEAAEWKAWWEEIHTHFSQLTGPQAPHVFKVCKRRDLGKMDHKEARTQTDPLPSNFVPSGDDVVVVIRAYMHSRDVLQVFTAWPACRCGSALRTQPAARSVHARRAMSDNDRDKFLKSARAVHEKRGISDKARDYLIGWAQGTLRRNRRPESYPFLEHRVGGSDSQGRPVQLPHAPAIRPVQVSGLAGGAAAHGRRVRG